MLIKTSVDCYRSLSVAPWLHLKQSYNSFLFCQLMTLHKMCLHLVSSVESATTGAVAAYEGTCERLRPMLEYVAFQLVGAAVCLAILADMALQDPGVWCA